jgi:hypothetical protein
VLDSLKTNERFIFDQLLERLCIRLSKEPNLAEWLQAPDTLERLRNYIIRYQSENAILSQRVARPAEATIVLPAHPDRYFSIQVEHLSQGILTQNHSNKILYVHTPELEPVIIENGWLCQMDMALLRTSPRMDTLEAALIQCVIGSDVPILILRNSDDNSLATLKQMQTWLRDRNLDESRIVDLELVEKNKSGRVLNRLVEMMPDELFAWVFAKLELLHIPIKFFPDTTDIRQDIAQQFEQLLLSYLWEGISKRLKMSRLLTDLDSQLQFTHEMQTEMMDQIIKQNLQEVDAAQSYSFILDKIVRQFFEHFLLERCSQIMDLTQIHLQHLKEAE